MDRRPVHRGSRADRHRPFRRDAGGGPAPGALRLFAGGAFALVNLPFIIAGPSAWAAGAAAPLTQHALPYGQGLVGLSAFLGIGGGAVDAYGLAGMALYVALLVVFVWRVDELRPAALLLPLLALFVSGRSLGEYWMAPIPAIVVLLARRVPRAGSASAAARPGSRLAALFAPAVVALAVALATPAPLAIHVLSATSDGRTDAVTTLRVEVGEPEPALVASVLLHGQPGPGVGVLVDRRGPAAVGARRSRA